MDKRVGGIAAVAGSVALITMALVPAGTRDGEAIPGFFVGQGVSNEAFTVHRNEGVELALRARLQFGLLCESRNSFNDNGHGEYFFDAADKGGCWGEEGTPEWNFEWSVNTDLDGSRGRVLSDLEYRLELDTDPGPGTDSLVFDPINRAWADHTIGGGLTGGLAQWQVAPPRSVEAYAELIASHSVAQNSWNYEFFDEEAPLAHRFDPTVPGLYDITLTALAESEPVAAVTIRVVVGDPPRSAKAD